MGERMKAKCYMCSHVFEVHKIEGIVQFVDCPECGAVIGVDKAIENMKKKEGNAHD